MIGVGLAELARAVDDLGQRRGAARRTGRAAPHPSAPRTNVHQGGARGVGRVGDVQSAGQPARPASFRPCRCARSLAGLAQLPASSRSAQRDLAGAEIGIEQQAGLRLERPARGPAPCSSAQSSAVRRSCQTIAGPSASPVRRSQKTIVSRWLVMPIAAIRSAPPALSTISRAQSSVFRQISSAIVLDPAGPRIMLGQLLLRRAEAGPVGREQHRPGAGRAFVDDEDRVRHGPHRHPGGGRGPDGLRDTKTGWIPAFGGMPYESPWTRSTS